MHRATARLLKTCVLLGLAACSEDVVSLGDGALSTIAVRVYVDQTGNGTYDTGTDVPIQGAEVTVTSEGVALTATTDSEGLASFQDVRPGTYTLELTATPPTGAVLATATSLTVAAPFEGAALTAEFRYAFLAGTLTGVVFRDDDGSGAFESGGLDTPAPDIELTLVSAAVDTVGIDTTDIGGVFTFAVLRPGSYTLEITPFGGLTFVAGASQMVTVGAETPTPFDIELTGVLAATSIADARGMPGAVVTLLGVITWQKQWDTRGFYLQDATGGITVFQDPAPTIQRGDSVRLRGTIGAFDGETQIGSIVSLSVIAQVGVPTPRSVTASQMNAGQFQGELARISGTVDSVLNPSFDNQLVFLTDGAGQTFTVFGDGRTGLALSDWTVGAEVVVVGVMATDDDDVFMFRIEPRDPNDLTVLQMPITIASFRGMAAGNVGTVEGVVTWQQEWDASSFYYQDATGGINTFDTSDPTLRRGDRIRIRGTVDAFRGEAQLTSIVSIAVLGQEALPTPRLVTGAEINAGQFQGELATIDGTVTSVAVLSFGSQMVFFTDGVGTTFTAFVDNRSGIASTDWTVGQAVTLVGILATDDRDAPPTARIELRDPSDMQ